MKYLNLSGLSYFLNKIKTYLTSSTYLNSIGISNSDIDDIADDAGYSSGSLPASEDIYITGDIIPNTDNSVDLGASSKNFKTIYTKGITINGTQFLPSDYATLNGLATVATSGSYSDLSNKPTIPTVNNATLTIQKNGTNVATFTSNSNTDVTCNITVPTKVSELTNDSGFSTSADRLPVGSYIQFAGSQAPDGFLVCNGGAISRTTYSALFAVIGTTYGSGDGSTTFNLPNLTDRFLQGSTSVGTVKNAGLPDITGSVYIGHTDRARNSYTNGCLTVTSSQQEGFNRTAATTTANYVSINASQSDSIYGNSSTVQPPALTCLICIKY